MKDFLGKDIQVGDHIVYGASLGRCAALCHAEVLQIREDAPKDRWSRPVRLVVRRIKTQHEIGEFYRVEDHLKSIYLYFPERVAVVQPLS